MYIFPTLTTAPPLIPRVGPGSPETPTGTNKNNDQESSSAHIRKLINEDKNRDFNLKLMTDDINTDMYAAPLGRDPGWLSVTPRFATSPQILWMENA